MERKIEEYLVQWKSDNNRKPLIIFGPRQVGKTFSVLNFGKNNYKNVAYFNTYQNKKLIDVFKKEKIEDKIILNLSMLSGETILQDDTLIILDNIDNNDVVKGLKLLGSEKSKYNIIAITARRGLLKSIKSEDLQYKSMTELDFEEYLIAHNEKSLADLIRESYTKRKTCPFHKVALDFFQRYLITGGMPEVVNAELNGYSDYELDAIKQKIIDVYEKDALYNKNLIDITRSIEVFESIPNQLSKKNKKFQYGVIKTGTRKTEYENSIEYLVENQLVYRSYKVKNIKSPLSSNRLKDNFKLYCIDNGLLSTMLHTNYKQILLDENVKEVLYQNHIAKALTEAGYSLYYYQSEGKAEVDFIIQDRMGTIIPIEIATRKDSKAKSLSVFMGKFDVPMGIRVTENNFSTKRDVRMIPIYAIFCLNENR
jgi:predicted AAA+ superfamily ATPase